MEPGVLSSKPDDKTLSVTMFLAGFEEEERRGGYPAMSSR